MGIQLDLYDSTSATALDPLRLRSATFECPEGASFAPR